TGCGLTWTSDAPLGDSAQSTSTASAGGACTVTLNQNAGNGSIHLIAIRGASALDVTASPARQGTITTGNPFNCPAVTTTATHDLVICAAQDINANGGAHTAGAGFTGAILGPNNWGTGIETKDQASTGSITPTWASYTSTTTIATMTAAFK